METVDPAAIRTSGGKNTARASAAFDARLVAYALAIASGDERGCDELQFHRDELHLTLEGCAARARRVPGKLAGTAAFDFLGDAIASAAVDYLFEAGEARAAVVAVARELGLSVDTAAFMVFRRALASKECIQLPPEVATDLVLALLVELAPAAAGSLWAIGPGGTSCLVAHGKAPRSRTLREVARSALDGVVPAEGPVGVQLVDRWDRPHAALVVRAGRGDSAHLGAYLAEAAASLAPLLERSATIDRRLEDERHLVAAGERRVVRLGADLHDGPLQELVLLAEELRVASQQIESIVSEENRPRVHGRFDDLHARLESLDESLREIARATRSAMAAASPVEESLDAELRRLERTTGVETEFVVEGDLGGLTDSQKIVLFRVVQEALSNVRKHSHAQKVSVVVRSTRSFLDLSITDDGRGFDVRKVSHDRLGLAGISERVRLLGGMVEIESCPNSGVKVRAILPQWRPSSSGVATMIPAGL